MKGGTLGATAVGMFVLLCIGGRVLGVDQGVGLDNPGSFDFIRHVPGEDLGIYITTMVQIERKLGQRVDLWRINTNYTTEESRDAFEELCRTQRFTKYSEKKDDDLQWGNCSFSREAINTHLTHGTPEVFNKNITYVEIKIRHFVRRRVEGDDEVEEACVLSEIPETTAYVAMLSFTFRSDMAGRDDPIYKLDRIMPEALSFFEDVIDVDAIYHFWPEDFLSRPPPYNCLLDIASGGSVESLEKYCSFSCSRKKVTPITFRKSDSHTEL